MKAIEFSPATGEALAYSTGNTDFESWFFPDSYFMENYNFIVNTD